MAPPALVLDASVILKWFRSQNETNLKAAHAYRRHHLEAKIRLAVPELLYYEILNELRRPIPQLEVKIRQLKEEKAPLERQLAAIMKKYGYLRLLLQQFLFTFYILLIC